MIFLPRPSGLPDLLMKSIDKQRTYKCSVLRGIYINFSNLENIFFYSACLFLSFATIRESALRLLARFYFKGLFARISTDLSSTAKTHLQSIPGKFYRTDVC